MKSDYLNSVRDQNTCGLLLKAGVDPLAAGIATEAVKEASRLYGAEGRGLVPTALEILAIHQFDDPQNNPGRIESAFSTAFGSEVLSGVANSIVFSQFRSGDSTKGWVSERPVTNFLPNERTREEHGPALAQLPRGDGAESLDRQFAAPEEYRVHRFARQFVVDEQDLVGADIDAIAQPSKVMAAAALRTKVDLIYSALLANAAMADGVPLFDASHNNLDVASPLTEASLDSAIASMQKTVENGAPLGLTPKYLIVAPELEGLARRLARGRELAGGENLIVRSESRLSNGVTDPLTGSMVAGNPTSWYLAIDAATGPTIEFGFIDSAIPKVRSWDLTEGAFGKGFSMKYDIGVKAVAFAGLRRADA